MPGPIGVTLMETNAAGSTVSAPELLKESSVALIVAFPWDTAFTKPTLSTVATVGSEDIQVAFALRFDMPPSLKVPVAVNCWLVPTGMSALVGVTEIPVRCTPGPPGPPIDTAVHPVHSTETATLSKQPHTFDRTDFPLSFSRFPCQPAIRHEGRGTLRYSAWGNSCSKARLAFYFSTANLQPGRHLPGRDK